MRVSEPLGASILGAAMTESRPLLNGCNTKVEYPEAPSRRVLKQFTRLWLFLT